MTLHEQINADMIAAMKSKDKETLELLRVVKGEFGRVGKDLSDAEAIPVIQKMVKNAEELGNHDEVVILQKYLPAMLGEQQIKVLAAGIINKNGFAGMQDMGKVMKELKMPTVDGKLASKVVRELLSQ